ncbi:Golgi autoantigen golgin subfamily a 7 [Fasciola gigantica]|uniref:Ras modification protein ERF4 n=1 Tax=Fasciola gigantica TaxID=46835 RepID=A0A504Z195_FASGI|nr:Golgi autoantigen golgin subfamily a 7 [Fasciola gigantica]
MSIPAEDRTQQQTTCDRVFIQRDFSEGTAVRFQTSPMPFQLRGRINPSRFADAISRLNKLFDEAESITPSVFMENMLGCLTAYLAFLCIRTHYEKVLQRVTLAVKDLNETVFIPSGLLMIDPAERGLRVIELCILHP